MSELTVMREVDSSAKISSDAYIGPFCVVGPDVSIGAGTRLQRRVIVSGWTTIGSDNIFSEGCVIGETPQDLKYTSEPSLLVIGDRNRFDRGVTAHIGTGGGGGLTRIGDDNVLSAGSHVAHDCFVDNGVYMGVSVLLAGHVRIEAGAVIEDFAGAHHFTTIGRYARVRLRTAVRRDVPPYTDFYSDNTDWKPPSIRGIHDAGVRSAHLDAQEELDLRQAMEELFADESSLQTKIEHLVNLGVEGDVAGLCEFCQLSLSGIYGRRRETLRGKCPPEAQEYFESLNQDRSERTNE